MTGHSDRRTFLKELSSMAAAVPFVAAPLGLTGLHSRRRSWVDPIADTTTGKVRGAVVDGINVFRGIPYGGDTGGRNRFMPPTRVQPWTGVRDALEWGRVAPQRVSTGTPGDYTTMVRWNELPGGIGEDCLVLNVYTPGLRDGARRPVMFSIHGGGYNSGTSGNPVFDGVALAKLGDVILVTINHRLGILGYTELGAYAPEFEGSGNAGMMDIVQALQWVRDNIENFGGDPNRVMIFGQSGGGNKVSHLMAMPSAKGLFHRAAMQSGAALRSGTREAANQSAEQLLTGLGLSRDHFRDLQNVPLETLIAQNGNFRPFLDGKLIPAHPFDPTAPALSADVPVIVGSNLHDSSYNFANSNLDEAGLMDQVKTTFGDNADRVLAAYRAADPRTTPYKLLGRINSDRGVRRNSIQLAERKSAQGGAPAYMYLLTYESVPFGGRFGSTHGTEMPLFYHNLDRWPIAGTGPAAQALAAKMAGAYIAFATTGKPTIPGFGEWPVYDAARRATMMFDTNTRVQNAPDQSLLAMVAAT